MKVKHKLAVIGILPSTVVLGVGLMLQGASRRMERIERTEMAVAGIVSALSDLQTLVADCLGEPAPNIRERWLEGEARIRTLLPALRADAPTPRQAAAVGGLSEGLLAGRHLFDRLVPRDPLPAATPGAAAPAARDLASLLGSLQAQVAIVAEESSRAMGSARRASSRSIMGLLLGASLVLAAVAFVTGHRIARALQALHHGADLIGMGNLDHTINLGSYDEIGRLAQAFTDMAGRLKHSHQELEMAVRRLEAHDRARGDFISNVSHELKTPLTSMTYEVGNLLDGMIAPLPERVREYLVMLSEDCQRLRGTVDDILDLSRIESNRMQLHHVRAPLGRLVAHSVQAMKLQAEARHVALDVAACPVADFVECDPPKLERVMLNLVGNALKFTEEGGRIEVAVCRPDARPGYAAVSVIDDGIGIPAAHVDKVTQKYYRVGEHVTGAGLGLPISKELVERHGGSLRIESPPPGRRRGTQVTVLLPTVAAPFALVFEMEAAVRRAIESHLLLHGYRVGTASGRGEPLGLIRRHPPDIVIADVGADSRHGEEIILHMKADPALRRIPVFAVSDGMLPPGRKGLLDGFGVPVFPRIWWVAGSALDRVENMLMGVSFPGRHGPEGGGAA